MKTIYRTVIEIEVLSEEPIPDDMGLDEIQDECNEGSFSGIYDFKVKNQEVKGIEAVKLIKAQGTDVEFFQMDEEGNELDDY